MSHPVSPHPGSADDQQARPSAAGETADDRQTQSPAEAAEEATEQASPELPPATEPPPPLPEREPPPPDSDSPVEAWIDLRQSHAFTQVAAVLQSFGEGFAHLYFDCRANTDVLIDEYANAAFRVAYFMREGARDQLRVAWTSRDAAKGHKDAELLNLARQIAQFLGGGTNLRLIERKPSASSS